MAGRMTTTYGTGLPPVIPAVGDWLAAGERLSLKVVAREESLDGYVTLTLKHPYDWETWHYIWYVAWPLTTPASFLRESHWQTHSDRIARAEWRPPDLSPMPDVLEA